VFAPVEAGLAERAAAGADGVHSRRRALGRTPRRLVPMLCDRRDPRSRRAPPGRPAWRRPVPPRGVVADPRAAHRRVARARRCGGVRTRRPAGQTFHQFGDLPARQREVDAAALAARRDQAALGQPGQGAMRRLGGDAASRASSPAVSAWPLISAESMVRARPARPAGRRCGRCRDRLSWRQSSPAPPRSPARTLRRGSNRWGRHSRICVLSLFTPITSLPVGSAQRGVPGNLGTLKRPSRSWVAGTSPAMTVREGCGRFATPRGRDEPHHPHRLFASAT